MTSPINTRRHMLTASIAAGAGSIAGTASATPAGAETKGPVRVVYHITQGLPQAARAMGNVRNHLSADPTARIVVVGNGAGIDFMLEGATDARGAQFAGNIGDLASRGVSFRACNNTLQSRNISKDKVVLDATIVPSGVAEVANLQFRDGYAYICP